MPSAEILKKMYSSEYAQLFHSEENMGGAYGVKQVASWLKREGSGTFIDYGCGAGNLLAVAINLGWRTVGVEFDEKLATKIAEEKGVTVKTPERVERESADVLHIGDVIEHLTNLERQMPEILSLLKPGGLLLAQGPLENNTNLFNFTIKSSRRLRREGQIEMPPYHVILATAEGQRMFFQQSRLNELEYSVYEDAWPAPAKLNRAELVQLRLVGLYLLRRCSQLATAIHGGSWGNRYFFAGRKTG